MSTPEQTEPTVTMAALLRADRQAWDKFLGIERNPVRRKPRGFWTLGDACPQLRSVRLTSV